MTLEAICEEICAFKPALIIDPKVEERIRFVLSLINSEPAVNIEKYVQLRKLMKEKNFDEQFDLFTKKYDDYELNIQLDKKVLEFGIHRKRRKSNLENAGEEIFKYIMNDGVQNKKFELRFYTEDEITEEYENALKYTANLIGSRKSFSEHVLDFLEKYYKEYLDKTGLNILLDKTKLKMQRKEAAVKYLSRYDFPFPKLSEMKQKTFAYKVFNKIVKKIKLKSAVREKVQSGLSIHYLTENYEIVMNNHKWKSLCIYLPLAEPWTAETLDNKIDVIKKIFPLFEQL